MQQHALDIINQAAIITKPAKLVDLFTNAISKTFNRHTTIFSTADAAERVYLVESGRVRIGSYSADGRLVTKQIINEGEIFGESALLGQSSYHNFASTMEGSVVKSVSTTEARLYLRQFPSLAQELLHLVGTRLQRAEQRLESLVFKSSRTRIIEFLCQLAERQGQRVGYEMLVRKFMTHQEIANITATSRQTVTTLLNELRSANVITFNRRRLLIRDMELLAQWGGQ